jgi:hypothetical protein
MQSVMREIKVMLVILAALAVPAAGLAIPTVSVEPETTVVDSGDIFTVRVMVDAEADTMSNFQIFITYDTSVLQFVQAMEGSLYANSGLQTWFYFNEEPPGTCEVWDVIFPAESFVLAPGELCKLRFEALIDGESPIAFISVDLKDILRFPIEPLAWTDGHVIVGDQSGIEHRDPSTGELGLGRPFPNPAHRGTPVSILLSEEGSRQVLYPVSITDSRGRLVAELDAPVTSSPGCLVWNGRNRRGRDVGPGVYFFKIRTVEEVVCRRVVIVR